MNYLILYYDRPEGPDGKEDPEEFRKNLQLNCDEDAVTVARTLPNAKLYKEIPLK